MNQFGALKKAMNQDLSLLKYHLHSQEFRELLVKFYNISSTISTFNVVEAFIGETLKNKQYIEYIEQWK